jgi:hypothetical protein
MGGGRREREGRKMNGGEGRRQKEEMLGVKVGRGEEEGRIQRKNGECGK